MHTRSYGTYLENKAWVTPLGNYNIFHYDCPTDEEIKQRLQAAVTEILNGKGFEDDCPLCQLMKKKPYDIVYYCQTWCHKCSKADICINFDPTSQQELESLDL